MEISKIGKNKKRTANAAFYFSMGMFFVGVIASIAILSLDQLQTLLDINSLRVLIYFSFILGGVLTMLSVAGVRAGAYRIKTKQ
jgi:hypothetical protein